MWTAEGCWRALSDRQMLPSRCAPFPQSPLSKACLRPWADGFPLLMPSQPEVPWPLAEERPERDATPGSGSWRAACPCLF